LPYVNSIIKVNKETQETQYEGTIEKGMKCKKTKMNDEDKKRKRKRERKYE
jgi:hypothetical protein